MKVLIVSQFVDFPEENGNDRFCYLADRLAGEDCKVSLLTSDFVHTTKKHRKPKNMAMHAYETILCYEPGYGKNVSLQRIVSHQCFADNVRNILDHLPDTPDVIYCAVPSLAVADVVRQYAAQNSIRFVVDIQDLWPEAFEMVLRVPLFAKLILFPLKRKADRIYANADGIVAVSQTYLERGLAVNHQKTEGVKVFLGTDAEMFDRHRSPEKLSDRDGILRVVYIGTLGHSYDLLPVFDALRILKAKGIDKIEMRVLGDGPLEEKFREYCHQYQLNVNFFGRVDYPAMIKELTKCDIAVNPICHGSAGSITNKVGDYFLAGLPVVSTQENRELKKMLRDHQCGFNCKNGSSKSLAKAIRVLADDEKLRLWMGENSRCLGEEEFDRRRSYQKIVDIIMS